MPFLALYCFCHCKDTNSKAIHNRLTPRSACPCIVFATAKILIRKQFTTSHIARAIQHEIVFATAKILIRKQFTTQLRAWENIAHCFCHCKDTNSKAIHNSRLQMPQTQWIVFATAKILIRKQFTTREPHVVDVYILFLPLQRY